MDNHQEIKVEVEALDGNVITPRTGKSKCEGFILESPVENERFTVFWAPEENTESPGVSIEVNGLDKLGSEYRFFDHDKRPFRVTVLS